MKNRPSVDHVMRITCNQYLNMYELDIQLRDGSKSKYYMASRAKTSADTSPVSGCIKSVGVVMVSTYEDKLVLLRQFRYPVGDYIYELPAGLIDNGEDIEAAAKREMLEETGLTLEISSVSASPWLSSPGMTDEACHVVFGKCHGTPTNENQEDREDISVILADRNEAKRILREEPIGVRAAFAIMSVFPD